MIVSKWSVSSFDGTGYGWFEFECEDGLTRRYSGTWEGDIPAEDFAHSYVEGNYEVTEKGISFALPHTLIRREWVDDESYVEIPYIKNRYAYLALERTIETEQQIEDRKREEKRLRYFAQQNTFNEAVESARKATTKLMRETPKYSFQIIDFDAL